MLSNTDYFYKNQPDFETKFAKFYKIENEVGELRIAKVINQEYAPLFSEKVYQLIQESLNDALLKIHEIAGSSPQKYTILEYFEGETLKERLQGGRKISKSELVKIIHDIGLGVDQLHECGVVHLDLVGNILINDECEVKIIDYDYCKIIDNDSLKKIDVMSFVETVLRIVLFSEDRESTKGSGVTYDMENMDISSCIGFIESIKIR